MKSSVWVLDSENCFSWIC